MANSSFIDVLAALCPLPLYDTFIWQQTGFTDKSLLCLMMIMMFDDAPCLCATHKHICTREHFAPRSSSSLSTATDTQHVYVLELFMSYMKWSFYFQNHFPTSTWWYLTIQDTQDMAISEIYAATPLGCNEFTFCCSKHLCYSVYKKNSSCFFFPHYSG